MIVADVPLADAALDAYDGLDLSHDLLALQEPLEPGQLLLLRSLDGVHRCAEVLELDVGFTRTVYRLRHGSPVAPEVARSLARRRVSPPRHWVDDSDVESLLAELAVAARRTAEAWR